MDNNVDSVEDYDYEQMDESTKTPGQYGSP